MINKKDLALIKEKLTESARPMFFFDDDADGISSFIQMYKFKGDGKGICVKGKPVLEKKYSQKVDEYVPDCIFILDKPLVEQEFLDSISQEAIWIDHHPVQNNKRVKYYNPRKENPEDNTPTSYWVYMALHDETKKPDSSIWIPMIGIVGDWNLLLTEEFRSVYPDLLPETIQTPQDALYCSELGKLVKIVDFNLKGSTSEVMKSIKILTRITDPYEILNQTSSKGKLIFKKYMNINQRYQELLKKVRVTEDPLLVFIYEDGKLALSSQLSNELLFKYPEKINIVVRQKSDDMIMAIRSSRIKISEILQEALKITTGHGGGHDKACGASVKKHEFDDFIKKFRELVVIELENEAKEDKKNQL